MAKTIYQLLFVTNRGNFIEKKEKKKKKKKKLIQKHTILHTLVFIISNVEHIRIYFLAKHLENIATYNAF